MSKSVNKVILIGNVTKDPEVKHTPSGTGVAKFGMATNERYKDKAGEWQTRTEYHNITCWAGLSEVVANYVHKGSRLYVEGKIQTQSWEDKTSGEKKYRTEIVANDVVMIDGNKATKSEEVTEVEEPAPF